MLLCCVLPQPVVEPYIHLMFSSVSQRECAGSNAKLTAVTLLWLPASSPALEEYSQYGAYAAMQLRSVGVRL